MWQKYITVCIYKFAKRFKAFLVKQAFYSLVEFDDYKFLNSFCVANLTNVRKVKFSLFRDGL